MNTFRLKLAIAAVVGGVPFVWAVATLVSPSPDAPAAADSPRKSKRSAAPARKPASRPAWGDRRLSPTVSDTVEPEPEVELTHAERVAAKIANAHHEEQAFVEAFESQPVDGGWAQTWETTLDQRVSEDLAGLNGFAGANIECRSDKCLGTVAWDNYVAAGASLGKTVHLTKGACATFSFMPPPQDPQAGYTHKIRFANCSDDDS